MTSVAKQTLSSGTNEVKEHQQVRPTQPPALVWRLEALCLYVSMYVCVRVCVYVCVHFNTETTGHIIKLARWIVHDKSWSTISFEVHRLNVNVTASN